MITSYTNYKISEIKDAQAIFIYGSIEHHVAVKAAHCNSNEKRINALTDMLTKNADSILDLTHSCHLKISLSNDKRDCTAVIATRMCVLEKIGVKFNLRQCAIDLEVQKIKILVDRMSIKNPR